MSKTIVAGALAAAASLSTPALAGSPEGRFQVRVMGSTMLPDGGIDKIKSIDSGLASTLAGAGVSDNGTRTMPRCSRPGTTSIPGCSVPA